MAPEALTDTSRDANRHCLKMGRASDVWSLGCILYQMCYGKPPFYNLSMIQRMQAITDPSYHIPFPPLPNPTLLQAMQACLNRDAKRRPTIPDLLQCPFLQPNK